MTAGKQVCPGEAVLGRGVTAVQWLLDDLYCPEVEGGMKLQLHNGFLTNNRANVASGAVISPHRPERAGA